VHLKSLRVGITEIINDLVTLKRSRRCQVLLLIEQTSESYLVHQMIFELASEVRLEFLLLLVALIQVFHVGVNIYAHSGHCRFLNLRCKHASRPVFIDLDHILWQNVGGVLV